MIHRKRCVFLITVTLIILLCYFLLNGREEVRQQKRITLPRHKHNFNRTLAWVVHVTDSSENQTNIDGVASDLKMINLGSVGHLLNTYFFVVNNTSCTGSRKQYLLCNKSDTDFGKKISEVEETLDKHGSIIWYTQEVVLSRQKRSLQVHFDDPFYYKQWHLHNTIDSEMDVNVTGIWGRGVTGQDVTVAVVDDGLEWTNPDLQNNYNAAGSWDLNDDDADPMPDGSKASNHHGTRCAGEIAAVPNTVCGVGVAYKAKVSGIRLLDGPLTDSLEAAAFTKNFQINDIYSCSWGPDDDGKTVDGPHKLAATAMKHGIDFGRHGYGSIYIMASGNGGQQKDNCNYDGYANSIYTVTIGAVNERGQMTFYSEECASMLAVTFSSGGMFTRDIVTTDWTSGVSTGRTGCTEHHTGTSASAPIAAGLIALMLEAQPCLTWRDVQYIIILTAVKVDKELAHYTKNGAGLWHSHKHGFGLLNAWRLVNAAKVWSQVPWLTSLSHSEDDVGLQIPKGPHNSLSVSHAVTEEDSKKFDLYVLETVQVTLTLTHPCRGQLEVQLVSPHGTKSVMGAPRPQDNSTAGFDHWTFSTVRCWGETAQGTWKVVIIDHDTGSQYSAGTLQKWAVKLYGTPMTPKQLARHRRTIEAAMDGRLLNTTPICAPSPVTSEPDVKLDIKTLKVLSLVGAFCFILAIYESFEYLFCYNEEKKEQSKMRKMVTRAHKLAYRAIYTDTGNQSASDDPSERTGLLEADEVSMTTMPSDLDFQDGFISIEAGALGAEGGDEVETSFIIPETNVLPAENGCTNSDSGGILSDITESTVINLKGATSNDTRQLKCKRKVEETTDARVMTPPSEECPDMVNLGSHVSMQIDKSSDITPSGLLESVRSVKEILKQRTTFLVSDPRYTLLQGCSSDSDE